MSKFGDNIHSNGLAMTATGQTGVDAYTYELQQIVNAQRELQERAERLAEIIEREDVDAEVFVSMATERFPEFGQWTRVANVVPFAVRHNLREDGLEELRTA